MPVRGETVGVKESHGDRYEQDSKKDRMFPQGSADTPKYPAESLTGSRVFCCHIGFGRVWISHVGSLTSFMGREALMSYKSQDPAKTLILIIIFHTIYNWNRFQLL